MAISANTYSQTQWKFALIAETDPGTANTTDMQLINIKERPAIARGAYRDQSVKSSDGRTAKKGDAITQEEAQEKTIPFTALVGKSELDILLENVTGNTISDGASGDGAFEIASNYTGGENGEIAIGTDTFSDKTGTLTAALISPETDASEILPGCVIRELTISGDTGTDGGLIEVSGTLVSWHKISDGQSAPTGLVDYTSGASVYDMYDLKSASSVTQIGGSDVVLAGFEITINNNVQAYGFDTDGNPEVIVRAVPEIITTGSFNIKYDANTKSLIEKVNEQTSDIAVSIYNGTDLQTADFGFSADYGWFSDDFDIGAVKDGDYIDVPFKFLGNDSDTMFAFTTLDNSA
ncbi:MAG: hypothetical protein R6U11_04610 [Bacteroidales bacterium]